MRLDIKLASTGGYGQLSRLVGMFLLGSTSALAAEDSTTLANHLDKAPSLTGNLLREQWSEATLVDDVAFRLSYDKAALYLDVERHKELPPAFTISMRGAYGSHTFLVYRHGSSDYRVDESHTGEPFRMAFSIPWKVTTFTPEDGPFTIEVRQTQTKGRPAAFQCAPSQPKKQQGDLLLSPFVVGSANTENSGYANAGLDYQAKYRDLNILGSISPDFRTVERSILNLDFSYYVRYAPETRPFFLSGDNYYAPTFLATQRIDTFDAGEKIYGKVDNNTTVGIMDTANFWDQNQFVAGVSREEGKADFSAGFKDLHDLLVNNQFSAGSFSYKDGPLRFSSDIQVTHDDQVGGGSSGDATLAYNKNGTFARVTATDTSAQFMDRLGYFTQPDVRGIEATVGARKSYPKGPIAGSGFSLFTLQLQGQSGALFQNYIGGEGSVDFKNGIGVDGSYEAGRFLKNRDRFGEVILTDTALGGRGRVGLDFTDGILASSNYQNVLPYFAYKVTPKFEVSGSFQAVHQFENQTQTIVHFNYVLNKNESLSGRVVEFQNQWNAYVRYHHQVNDRFIYEVIVGDPNAIQTQRALWLKMIFPMDVKF